MEPAVCTIDGFGPLPLDRPGSVAELGETVRRVAALGQAIYPVGGQTMLDLGYSPTKSGRAIDMRGLDQVIDFPARDMTVTVQAGITIAKLRVLAQPENLQLPIDVPDPDRATLGGILAANVSGPRRLGYGTLRDYVIGVSAVNDEGNEYKAGGRVVKNVAGYDICKLLVGSLGTLGVITQVTLKLRPLPEETALVAVDTNLERLAPLLERLHATRTRPALVEVLNPLAAKAMLAEARAASEGSWVVIVGLEGNGSAVNWQVQQLVMELGGDHSLDACLGTPAKPLRHRLLSGKCMSQELGLKATVPAHAIAGFAAAVDRAQEGASIQIHAANGIVRGGADGLTAEQAGDMVTRWRRQAGELGGRVVVERCPSAWKKEVDVWGVPTQDVALMREVKRRFDPRGVFNPGRFVSDI